MKRTIAGMSPEEWAELLSTKRARVLELSLEERERAARLWHRYYVLADACKVLGGATCSQRRRAELLEDLEGLREEAHADFRAYEAEVGVPELGVVGA